MSLNKLLDSGGEMLIELRRNELSLWDVTSPHYSNARLARFLFLLLNAKRYQSMKSSLLTQLLIITMILRQTTFLI